MEDVKPIKPSEVLAKRSEVINKDIIRIVNNFLSLRLSGPTDHVKITIAEIKEEYLKTHSEQEFKELSKNGHLSIESVYIDNGWNVDFDSPAYNETYQAYFEFTPKQVKSIV